MLVEDRISLRANIKSDNSNSIIKMKLARRITLTFDFWGKFVKRVTISH